MTDRIVKHDRKSRTIIIGADNVIVGSSAKTKTIKTNKIPKVVNTKS